MSSDLKSESSLLLLKDSSLTESSESTDQSSTEIYNVTVRYRDQKRKLKCERQTPIDEIRKQAFALFNRNLNDNNSIIVYHTRENGQILLEHFPVGDQHNLSVSIVTINPVCTNCHQPFGIRDDDRVYECPTENCGEQFCRLCIQSIQQHNEQRLFSCLNCRKIVEARQNELIDRFLLWPRFCRMFGEEKLIELERNNEIASYRTLLDDVSIRRFQIQSRLRTLLHHVNRNDCDLETVALIQTSENFVKDLDRIYYHVVDLKHSIKQRSLSVPTILDRYKNEMEDFDILCEMLMESIASIENGKEQVERLSEEEWLAHIKVKYMMNKLQSFRNDSSLSNMESILEDIEIRRKILETYVASGDETNSDVIRRDEQIAKLIEILEQKLRRVEDIQEDLYVLHTHGKELSKITIEYIRLMTDSRARSINCSRFALIMEELRYEIEDKQRQILFPLTYEHIHEWQQDPGEYENFKPKMSQLFQTLENDLRKLFVDQNLNKIPLRIGLVGKTSVGKSSLTSYLGDIHDHDDRLRFERNLFRFLQREILLCYHDVKIQTTLINIESFTGEKHYVQQQENYFDLIRRADCDIYLIVFDRQISNHNRSCLDFIENQLKRKCLLVLNKADRRFKEFYEKLHNAPYDLKTSDNSSVLEVFTELRRSLKPDMDLDFSNREIYLISARPSHMMKAAHFIDFDKEKLLKTLIQLARNDCRRARIGDLAVTTARIAINTCFRRSYMISSLKYRIGAAFTSILPFADEAFSFFSREKIGQAFGILEHSSLWNKIHGRKNNLEEYFQVFNLQVPDGLLVSGCFDYLVKKREIISKTNLIKCYSCDDADGLDANIIRQRIIQSYITSSILFSMNEITSISCNDVVDSVGTYLLSSWVFHTAGKQMMMDLHKLCNDSFIVTTCFIVHLCQSIMNKEELSSLS